MFFGLIFGFRSCLLYFNDGGGRKMLMINAFLCFFRVVHFCWNSQYSFFLLSEILLYQLSKHHRLMKLQLLELHAKFIKNKMSKQHIYVRSALTIVYLIPAFKSELSCLSRIFPSAVHRPSQPNFASNFNWHFPFSLFEGNFFFKKKNNLKFQNILCLLLSSAL